MAPPPQFRGQPSVCKPKSSRQTKMCNFNKLRDVSNHAYFATPRPKPPDFI